MKSVGLILYNSSDEQLSSVCEVTGGAGVTDPRFYMRGGGGAVTWATASSTKAIPGAPPGVPVVF